ncbi:MAG: outer membrane lipoprotein carrier protein LolA [Cytophagia bacterium]|nr:outer membrane lipoprotein carrier protein LolA [Cytophagia bacterium]
MRRVLVVCWMVISLVAAGQEQDPKAILDKMSSVYKAMPGYEIGFVQKILSESEVIDRLTGEASVSKDKFMIKFQDQHIYCNGTVLWTYLVESQELTISNFEPDEAVINPSNVYDIYKEGFTYEYKRQDNINGELVHVVELTSTDEDADFTNVIMYISQKTSYLKAWDLVDYAGAKTAFEVSSFKPNVTFADGFFEFDEEKNPVTYREDLRN